MKVKLFGGLRKTAGFSQVEGSGATIREVLEQLCVNNKTLHESIFNGSELHPHVRVILNGRDSELLDSLETPVSKDDQIAIFPPIAGGK